MFGEAEFPNGMINDAIDSHLKSKRDAAIFDVVEDMENMVFTHFKRDILFRTGTRFSPFISQIRRDGYLASGNNHGTTFNRVVKDGNDYRQGTGQNEYNVDEEVW